MLRTVRSGIEVDIQCSDCFCLAVMYFRIISERLSQASNVDHVESWHLNTARERSAFSHHFSTEAATDLFTNELFIRSTPFQRL